MTIEKETFFVYRQVRKIRLSSMLITIEGCSFSISRRPGSKISPMWKLRKIKNLLLGTGLFI